MHLFKDALLEALKTISESASATAKKHKISQSQMSAFTSGNGIPKAETLVQLCAAFTPPVQMQLARAWVQERVGPEIADLILSSSPTAKSKVEKAFSALPAAAQTAFLVLMNEARISEDLRASLERLASYITPQEAEIPQPRKSGRYEPPEEHLGTYADGEAARRDRSEPAPPLPAKRTSLADDLQRRLSDTKKR